MHSNSSEQPTGTSSSRGAATSERASSAPSGTPVEPLEAIHPSTAMPHHPNPETAPNNEESSVPGKAALIDTVIPPPPHHTMSPNKPSPQDVFLDDNLGA